MELHTSLPVPGSCERNMNNQRSLNVIVVDDVVRICNLVADFLSGIAGVKVVGTANSIKEALKCITELEPDAVVLDISMPRFELMQSGVDVLRWIKQHYPATAVIMLTNHSEMVYRRICQELGAYAFLDKSAEPELLHTAVTQLVEAHTKPPRLEA